MTEIRKVNIAEGPSNVNMSSMTDKSISDIAEVPTDEPVSATGGRPESCKVKRSTNEHVSCMKERPKSVFTERPVKRQVSFQLNHQHHDSEGDVSKQKQKEISHIKKPVIRQCSFQHNQYQLDSHTDHDSHTRHDSLNKKKSLADMLPELMQKFKAELGCKSFIVNTRKAVDRKRQMELSKPKEREWMKGSEMQAFYHTWQTSDDHLKDQSVRPRTVRRIKSLPRDFRTRMTEPVVETKKPSKKNLSEFGIVRECCSHPRMRIPPFQD